MNYLQKLAANNIELHNLHFGSTISHNVCFLRPPCSWRLDNLCTIHKHGKGTKILLYSSLVATYVDEK